MLPGSLVAAASLLRAGLADATGPAKDDDEVAGSDAGCEPLVESETWGEGMKREGVAESLAASSDACWCCWCSCCCLVSGWERWSRPKSLIACEKIFDRVRSCDTTHATRVLKFKDLGDFWSSYGRGHFPTLFVSATSYRKSVPQVPCPLSGVA
jgi:hypothetical protein